MQTLIDFDLDWLNDADYPFRKISRILKNIPRDIPATIQIEHQSILPFIESLNLDNPHIIHIDQHHDFYALPNIRLTQKGIQVVDADINCANWGYYLQNYRRFTWVKNKCSDTIDVKALVRWFTQNKKQLFITDTFRFDRLKDMDVRGAFFCVSPDYCSEETLFGEIPRIVTTIADHFNLDTVPVQLGQEGYRIDSWKLMNCVVTS